MSLDYEKKKFKVLKEMVDNYWQELQQDRQRALDMPIETDNGFNVEREALIEDIDEKLEILRRHAKQPYFAKLIFKDLDDGKEFNGYIGRLSIGDISTPDDTKVVDWRAPISDLYYNGRLGNSSYMAHGNSYSVDLKLKRQIDIKDGEVKSIFDFEETTSTDEFLKPFLTESADNRLKNIVATIQQEQNNIIRLPVFTNCIVQGVAGSGKTTVALHRLSYLMYNFKKSIRPEEFLIISPNEIFMSYISSTLVDLDADKSNSFSINKLIENIIGTDYKILPKHKHFVELSNDGIATDFLKFKNKKSFANIIDKFIEEYKLKTICADIYIKGVKVLESKDIYKYFGNPGDLPLEMVAVHGKKKLNLALDYDENLRKKAIRNIETSEQDFITKINMKKDIGVGINKYIKKITNKTVNILKLYQEFISNIENFTDYSDVEILKKSTLNNLRKKILAYDDLAPVLYLYTRIFELQYYNSLKCVFIDEAQDLSELMYVALKKAFPKASFSIFGDEAQGIYSYQSIDKWQDIIDIISDSKIHYLTRGYRTSIEIMEDANVTLKKLGFNSANNVVRHGEKVDRYSSNDVVQIKTLLEKLNKDYSHTAIIVKDEKEMSKAMKNLGELNLTCLDENNLNYVDYKNVILTVQTAKGLEFDSVIIYDEKSYTDTPNDLKLLYVAKTRALHKLILARDIENIK